MTNDDVARAGDRTAATPGWLYAAALLPAAVVVASAAVQPWVPVEQLFRDVLSAAGRVTDGSYPWHLGLVSNLGILLWSGTAAGCLLGGLIVRHTSGSGSASTFLLSGALLTALLTVDDFFMAHEQIYPRPFGLGEVTVFVLYALLVAAYVLFFRRVIRRVGPQLLVLALALFAAGLSVDIWFPTGEELQRVAEDGPKFLGIATWATFHLRAAWLLSIGRERGAHSS